jgi:hypothetical protein
MCESKRYWVVIHYETEVKAENEWDACHEIRMGNTIVENATIIAKELPDQDGGFKELIQEARREARKEEALSIVLRQLAHRTGNYSLLWDKSSSQALHIQSQLQKLSLEQLELLSLDALEFSTVDELKIYLDKFTEA